MMATKDVGDIKETAMHQPLLSPVEPFVVVSVLQCEQVTSQHRTALFFVKLIAPEKHCHSP